MKKSTKLKENKLTQVKNDVSIFAMVLFGPPNLFHSVFVGRRKRGPTTTVLVDT